MTVLPRSRVHNVSDAQQVENAKREMRDERELLLDSTKRILETDHGVRLFGHLLVEFGTYRSVKNTGTDDMAYNSGRQDAGFSLEALIVDALPDAMVAIQIRRIELMRAEPPKKRKGRKPDEPAPELIVEPSEDETDDGN